MTIEEATNTMKEWIDKPMTEQQQFKYRCAQSKILKAIVSGQYKLVKADEVKE